jgi:hypothetical protein
MASKFGGIPVSSGSKFGGIPLEEDQPSPLDYLKNPGHGDNYLDRLQGNAESLMTAASTPVAMAVGGYAGMAQAMNPFAEPGAGARTAAEVQEEWTYKPRSQEGQQNNKVAAEMAQKAIDMLNIPISYLGYAVELFTYETPEKAMETLQSIQEKGALKTVGDRVLESTDSPLLATAAEVVPQALAAGLSLATGGGTIARNAGSIGGMDLKGIKPTAQAMAKYQGRDKQGMGLDIRAGSTDEQLAGFKLDETPISGVENIPQSLRDKLGADLPNVVPDKTAEAAIYQGLPERVVTPVKTSNRATKALMVDMLDIGEKVGKNALYAQTHTAGQIAGNAANSLYSDLKTRNSKAGKAIDKAAQGLRKKQIDISGPIKSFEDALDKMGVKYKKVVNGNEIILDKLVFDKKSDLFGRSKEAIEAQTILNDTMERLRDADASTAYDAHTLKRFIDGQVSFGKTPMGMPGYADRILKDLRRQVDATLDGKFKDYDLANTEYSETINAMNGLTDISRKLDFNGNYADMGMGVILRRLMSNTAARTQLQEALNEMQRVSNKYGKTNPKDNVNIGALSLLANEIEIIFGALGETSFQGIINRELGGLVDATTSKAGMADLGLKGVKAAAEKLKKPKNKEEAYKAFYKLVTEDRQ